MQYRHNPVSLRALLFLASITLVFGACGDDVSEEPEKEPFERPDGAQEAVPDDILERMEEAGHPVYGGNNPPELEGGYLIRDGHVVYDERWEDHEGRWCDATRYFYATDDPEIYEASQILEGTCSGETHGEGFYVSGDDNCFSLYAREEGEFEGCQRDLIRVLSGCIVEEGIEDYRQAQIAMDMQGENCESHVDDRRINGVDYLRLFHTDLAVRIEEEQYERPEGAQEAVPDDILARMEDAGHPIYPGDDPPDIEGGYQIRDGNIVYDERWEDHEGGWCDATRHFYATDDPEVYEASQVLENNCSGETHGEGFYASGEGDCFSLYAREVGEFEGCQRDLIRVLSGCMVEEGIEDYRQAQIAMDQAGESCEGLVDDRRINGVDYLRLFHTDIATRVQ